ncbi:VWA domain-containing protein [candidate division WOR-3 bacterium]|nr:VWA domain-containing protein [candidate division WOR-3 bacterium]
MFLHFANTLWLLVLLIIPIIILWELVIRKPTMKYSSIEDMKSLPASLKLKMRKIFPWVGITGVVFLVLGLARPQKGRSYEEYITKGIDIMLALDISSSMRCLDYRPYDRIQMAINAAQNFINGRGNDRIGLVLFAKDAFTQCPLTLDHEILSDLLQKAEVGMIEDGTAIGMGLATAVNRLKESDSKSRIIVLLTDGRNNAGKIDPGTASELAKSYDIKVYTIGAGKKGETLYPVDNGIFGRRYTPVLGVDIDEEILKEIANLTDGLYFRAETPEALSKVYEVIDKMEKVEIKTKKYTLYKEIFKYFVLTGLVLLLIPIILNYTILLKIP